MWYNNSNREGSEKMGKRKYDVAAYIWPAFTGDEPRTRIFWEKGIGEWQTVMSPTDKPGWKYSGAKPIWGYENEADPGVMERQIACAAEYGVNVFIYDWYWFDGRPFLDQCLNNGYLKAKNNDRVKFYLMWANHDVNYMWDKRINHINSMIWHGWVRRPDFDEICDRAIAQYFTHPSYYKIDGKPVFLIYDVENLIRGLGGIEATAQALDAFRKKVTDAGFPGLELQLCAWSENAVNLSGVDSEHSGSTLDAVKLLHIDSITNYQFAHLISHPKGDYTELFRTVRQQWERYDREYDVPYYPHISVGWDNNLRCYDLKRDFITNNTPECFGKALQAAKDYLDAHPERTPLVTINSWNEWTEGSYLEPDTVNGYGYLEEIRRVFAAEEQETEES